jgi:hypothetical protein
VFASQLAGILSNIPRRWQDSKSLPDRSFGKGFFMKPGDIFPYLIVLMLGLTLYNTLT